MKKKIGLDSLKIVLVLTAIAVFAGVILGTVNYFSAVDEAQALKEQIGELYPDSPIKKALDVSGYKNLANTQIKNAFVANDGAYIIQSHSDNAYSSDGLTLIVIIKDDKIVKVDGGGNGETPGLGSKALTEEYFQSNVVGLSVEVLIPKNSIAESEISSASEPFSQEFDLQRKFEYTQKEADTIAGISGATKTSNGVKNAIKAAAVFYVEAKEVA